jgi:O-antigen/teichoic acid export membrane protein
MNLFANIKKWITSHPVKAGALAGWYQQACSLLAAVVAVPLVIRLLSVEEAGLWFAFQATLAIIQLTDFGFSLVLSRQIAFSMTSRGLVSDVGVDFLDIRHGWEGVSDIYALTRILFRWVCGFGVVALAILYHAVLPLGKMIEHRNVETALSWYILGFSALLLIQAKPHQALLDGMGRIYLTRIMSGTQFLLSGFGVVAVLMCGGRLIHMACTVLVTAVLNYLAVRWCVRWTAGHRLVPSIRLPRTSLVKFLRVALPLGVLSLSAFFVTSVQIPLVGFLLGPAVVPAYFLAQRIGVVLNQACLQGMYPQFPLFTQEIGACQYSEARQRMRRTLVLTTGLIIVTNIAYYFAVPSLVDKWVGPGRYLAGLPLLILAVDFCLMNGSGIWGGFVLARGINPFMWSTLLAGVMTLVMCVVLGQRFGVLGIATASLVAGLCTNYWFAPLQGLKLLKALKNSKLQAL